MRCSERLRRHGTCFRRRLSTRHARAAPASAVAELGVVRRGYAPVSVGSMTNLLTVRSLLVLFALVFCLPLFVHSRFIESHFESLRSPATAGLLPATFLFLRFFGQLSACFPVIFAALLVWSFFRPASIPPAVGHRGRSLLVFLVAYVCYALLLVGGLLASRHA